MKEGNTHQQTSNEMMFKSEDCLDQKFKEEEKYPPSFSIFII